MGNRANIIVKSENEQVCLYTHWDGSTLDKTLKSAMIRGKDRWTDFQYLTRIIFCEMIKGKEQEIRGFGITQKVHDGDRNVYIVDVDDSTVRIHGVQYTFEEFVSEGFSQGIPICENIVQGVV